MRENDPAISPDWTVIAPYLRRLIDTIESLGVNREAFVTALSIDEQQLQDSEHRFPIESLIQAFELGASQSGCEDLGIKFGTSLSVADQGVIGYISCCTNNMIEAMETFIPIRRMMMHSGTTLCLKGEHYVAFEWTPMVSRFDKHRYFSNAIFSNWVNAVSVRSDCPCIPAKVEFTTGEPKDKRGLREIFGDNLHFNCEKNRITFHRQDAEREFVATDHLPIVTQEEQRRLIKQAESDLKHIPDAQLTTALVEKHIMQLLPTGDCTLSSVAKCLHMTERTLQRRLRVDQTRFNELLKNVRLRWAKNYLVSDSMPITDIALVLGYQETSAFTHAFRSWMNLSPVEFRAKMKQQGDTLLPP